MTPQERQLVDDLFDRLARVDGAPRDPDATTAIGQGLQRAPNALYALVQTVLLALLIGIAHTLSRGGTDTSVGRAG